VAVQRIGFLGVRPLTETGVPIAALNKGLRDVGYVEGSDYGLDIRVVDNNPDRYPEMIRELTQLRVKIIVAASTPAAVAIHKEAPSMPIVVRGPDVVGAGLAESVRCRERFAVRSRRPNFSPAFERCSGAHGGSESRATGIGHDRLSQEAASNGRRSIALTHREFELLSYLADRRDVVVHRQRTAPCGLGISGHRRPYANRRFRHRPPSPQD
jgi:ABC transporter substrate binding protein